MKPIISFALLGAIFAIGANAATTPPVGYMTVDLPGAEGGAPTRLQLGNQGLLPSASVQTAGEATSFGTDGTGSYLQDDAGTWAAGDYVNGTQSSCVLELTSGALAGTLTWIVGSDANKLYTSDDLGALGAAATDSYRVLLTFTVGSLLGEEPDAAVLGGGGNLGDADEFLLLDPTTGVYTTFWYKNAGLGGTGWRSAGIANDMVASTPIFPSDGLVFQRKQAEAGALVIAGDVKTTATEVAVAGDPGATVLNMISIQIPVDQLTMSASGLYTGDAATGVKGGGNLGDADEVLIYDATTGIYTTLWYKSSGLGGTGWRAAGVADADNYVIPSAGSILIQRKSGESFSWSVPAPTIGE